MQSIPTKKVGGQKISTKRKNDLLLPHDNFSPQDICAVWLPVKDKASQTSGMDGGGCAHKAPLLAEH